MKRAVLAAVGALALATAANAQTVSYLFTLEGLQEVPPNLSQGSGLGNVSINTLTNQLSWDISYANLMGVITAAHFHGPAGFGVNAGVQVNIGVISGLPSPMLGSTTITEAQKNDLLNGLWYVNIHSNLFPGGEIRGQVVPTPGAIVLLSAAGVLLVTPRRTRNRSQVGQS